MKINKWTIWRANLDPVIGSEQGKSRPVLIISEDDINSLLNIVNIVPITSRKQDRIIYPNEYCYRLRLTDWTKSLLLYVIKLERLTNLVFRKNMGK